jgi:cytochrome c oxidase subunit 2
MHIDRLERYWLIAVAVTLGAFIAALTASIVIFGVRLPSPVDRIDPRNLQGTGFEEPTLRDLGDGRYEAYILAEMWKFTPKEFTIPQGSYVTFYVTSKDVTHGFEIEKHNANLMLLPGQIARVEVHFNRVGDFHIICHEYCGPGHQNMVAKITVE